MFGSFAREGACIRLEEVGGGKFHYTAVHTDSQGRAHHQDGIFAFDGRDLPDGDGGTLAFTRIDAERYAVVMKGAVRGLAMRMLSGDTMTETADGTDNGEAFHAVRVYQRGAGSCD